MFLITQKSKNQFLSFNIIIFFDKKYVYFSNISTYKLKVYANICRIFLTIKWL